MEVMEDIDDDCDVHGVHFVKISDPAAAAVSATGSSNKCMFCQHTGPSEE